MKLENTFCIAVPVDEAWRVLLDIGRVAPCVPGAAITSRDGDQYSGSIKVKVGPIALKYAGIIETRSKDETAKAVVFEGRGREARGNGTASAVITCRLSGSDGHTDVFVETELEITGKTAQFGRGALAEVANKLIGQFAANLAEQILVSAGTSNVDASENAGPRLSDGADPTDVVASQGSSTHIADRTAPAPPIELFGIGGRRGRITRVLIPAAAVVLAVPLLIRRRHRTSA
ncbi:SRPBCC family protein [Rhodococcus sp. CH91]|uniref:SRPBCC family protein n=1 Tax=Rhodococcus sp. CH91 TaxID=2910256 RepID=UPI001F4AD11F|nr:SRPBCC family protein [Rhodococcus sp. CH91]